MLKKIPGLVWGPLRITLNQSRAVCDLRTTTLKHCPSTENSWPMHCTFVSTWQCLLRSWLTFIQGETVSSSLATFTGTSRQMFVVLRREGCGQFGESLGSLQYPDCACVNISPGAEKTCQASVQHGPQGMEDGGHKGMRVGVRCYRRRSPF